MPLDFNKGGSRYGRTTKRKKNNMVLNILIGIVFIFIVVLASSLFFGKNDPASVSENQLATDEQALNKTEENSDKEKEATKEAAAEEKEAEAKEAEEKAAKEEAAAEKEAKEKEKAEKEAAEKEKEKEKEKDEESESDSDQEGTEVTENSDDPNVIKTMTNPGWGPVGTEQSEPHTSVYDESHVDWKEKLDAVHAATGLKSGDYTLMFMGNGGSAHTSVASISVKSSGENYKVYLEWVTKKGWKPTKVEQVKEL